MYPSEIISFFNKIENEFNVYKITFNGHQIWPVLRILIGWEMETGLNSLISATKNTSPLKKSIKASAGDILSAWQNYNKVKKKYYNKKQQINKLNQQDSEGAIVNLCKTKALILSYTAHRTEKIGGKYFNIYVNGLEHFLKKYCSTAILEFAYDDNYLIPRYSSSYYIDSMVLKKEVLIAFSNFKNNIFKFISIKPTSNIEFFDEWIKWYEDNCNHHYLNKEILLYSIIRIMAFSEMFNQIFDIIQPDIFFTVNYNWEMGLAAIFAANNRKIKTVDLQHGPMNIYPFKNWMNIPMSGSNFLPHYFWIWDKESSQMLSWLEKSSFHHSITGGNIWKAIVDTNIINFEMKDTFKLQLMSGQIIALFTLGYATFRQELIPNHLLQAIKSSNDDIYWLIRMHPRKLYDQEDVLKLLQGINKSKYNIEDATETPLPLLLNYLDYHITKASSVCIEAHCNGVKNIIIDYRGKDIYKTNIDNGSYYFAETADKILSILSMGKITRMENIETIRTVKEKELDLINQAIKTLLK